MSRRGWAFITLVLALSPTLAACKAPPPPARTLRVGATPVPHAELLRHVVPALAAVGVELQVVELTDYLQPNLALLEGELEANFFQHEQYLARFNAERGASLVSAAKVHVEPLGGYSRKIRALDQLPDEATVALPNDPTNEARALTLLASQGLLRLDPAKPAPTILDVVDNPRRIQLRALDAAQLPRALDDVTVAIINTNYALTASLSPARDALFREDASSPYVNVLVVRPELRSDPRVLALARALRSEDARAFLATRYKGAVVPVE